MCQVQIIVTQCFHGVRNVIFTLNHNTQSALTISCSFHKPHCSLEGWRTRRGLFPNQCLVNGLDQLSSFLSFHTWNSSLTLTCRHFNMLLSASYFKALLICIAITKSLQSPCGSFILSDVPSLQRLWKRLWGLQEMYIIWRKGHETKGSILTWKKGFYYPNPLLQVYQKVHSSKGLL